MKILTKKKQDDILMRIAANMILLGKLINSEKGSDEYYRYMERIADNKDYIIRSVAGTKGFNKVKDFVDELMKLMKGE